MRCGSHRHPAGSYPAISPVPEPEFRRYLSVALSFQRNIVRRILLFKRTPCPVQSGLSSPAKTGAIARVATPKSNIDEKFHYTSFYNKKMSFFYLLLIF